MKQVAGECPGCRSRQPSSRNEGRVRVLAALDTVATKVGATPAQVALAWLIARPSITAPIVSATSLVQLDEIIGAARLKLDADAIERLNEASA
jgi:aryl-alcohol dehydrogenase-like predicted oxidoreductase